MSKRVITFGEIMLRLAPEGYYRFVQANNFGATYGGGEANVAVSLANYGFDAAFVTKLPKHEIGQAAVNELRRYGVDTSTITRGGDRVGIYFLEKGASQRPSKVIYDRAHSAISEATPEDFDWAKIFEGADWFHFTGITPALNDTVAAICLEACKKAKELGMNDTKFEDCCGLTDSDGHYTTAADVAKMSRELIERFPQILNYSSIWMEEITHVTQKGSKPFTLTNTNKLIRGYEGCVGLKTGSTSKAKYCVSAVAKKNDLTMLAVVMGAPDYKVRFADAASLFQYGFSSCSIYIDRERDPLPELSVVYGKQDTAELEYAEEFRYLATGGTVIGEVEKTIELPEEVQAPIQKGECAGRVVYKADGEELGSVAILYGADVARAGMWDLFGCTMKQYFLGTA